jgi:hypothetical protein
MADAGHNLLGMRSGAHQVHGLVGRSILTDRPQVKLPAYWDAILCFLNTQVCPYSRTTHSPLAYDTAASYQGLPTSTLGAHVRFREFRVAQLQLLHTTRKSDRSLHLLVDDAVFNVNYDVSPLVLP